MCSIWLRNSNCPFQESINKLENQNQKLSIIKNLYTKENGQTCHIWSKKLQPQNNQLVTNVVKQDTIKINAK